MLISGVRSLLLFLRENRGRPHGPVSQQNRCRIRVRSCGSELFLVFVEIPEIDLVSFERSFRPGIPQTEMMVMVGGRTIGHHFASQCLQRMDETAAFIDRVNARGWVNRGIVVREQQFISYLIV